MDSIYVGSGPAEETCEQANVSGSNYERMKAECKAFIGQLRRTLGEEPDGARLVIKFERDGNYGYYSVYCQFEPRNKAALDYAFRCDGEAPAHWDEIAKVELANVPTGVQA